MTNRLEIVLPHQQIFMTQFGVLEAENPHLRLVASKEALYISGKNFALENRDFFTLHVNNQFHLNDSFIDAFLAENQHIKPEFILPGKIIINMLTPEMIAAFSALIIAGMVVWNRNSKKGRIYDGTARFDIEINRETYIEKQRRAPDFSFVSFDKITREKLNQSTYIQGSPSFCGEIVSQKHQLKVNLQKMREVWMASGTEIGLVICPYRKKYYLFDHSVHYSIHDFSKTFRHSQLPGLELDFAALLEEIND